MQLNQLEQLTTGAANGADVIGDEAVDAIGAPAIEAIGAIEATAAVGQLELKLKQWSNC